MNQRHAWIFSLALIGVGTYASGAQATTYTFEGVGCEFKGGVDCQASCGQISFEASCDAQLAASCRGQCTAQAEASCTGSCQGTCEAQCKADPGSITCQGQCTESCGGECTGHCAASATGDSAQADCRAKCKASCNASCDASCTGTPPQADCSAKCQGSCSGQCSAKANIDCQVACQATGHASCVVDANADCSANCTSHGGVLVCDGAVQAFLDTVEAAQAWIEQHIVVNGTSSASCSGNTCHAEASASVSTKCSAVPAPVVSAGGLASAAGAELGVFGLALLVGGARKRGRRANASNSRES